MVNTILRDCHILLVGRCDKSEWTDTSIRQWIKNASGIPETKPSQDTTHALVTEKDWLARHKVVQEILDLQRNGQNIRIVSYDWLGDSLHHKTAFKAKRYDWQVPKKAGGTDDGRSGASGMLKVFTNSTDDPITEREKKRIEKQIDAEQKARKEEEDAIREDMEKQRNRSEHIKKVAAVFRRGVLKSRNELLSDNHHVYHEPNHFAYDVTLTKVDTKNNKNNRLTLTIYESNQGPPCTYAFNCHFAGTGIAKENSVVAALGSTFEAAMRCFKDVFKEKTRVNWEDRMDVAALEQARLASGQHFEDRPYVYHPPTYGPKGDSIPVSQQGQLAENGGKGDIDHVMSGANGTGEDSSIQAAETDDFLKAREFDRMVRNTEMYAGVVADAFEDPFSFGSSTLDLQANEQDHEGLLGETPMDGVAEVQVDADTSGDRKRKDSPIEDATTNDQASGNKKAKTSDQGAQDDLDSVKGQSFASAEEPFKGQVPAVADEGNLLGGDQTVDLGDFEYDKAA